MLLIKPTGYYKNVYLGRGDYLTGDYLKQKRRNRRALRYLLAGGLFVLICWGLFFYL
ncbi:MAG: hypothetical protein JSS81_11595 [Acidobacteria bacterium]|nr:hypothetical protein [Acidobacteriota bacterium]